ncbi:cellobiose phosphorylase [Paenibacillus sp. Marseille-Q4541]|uniref:GH36-type glycosyl hydrolase domain-containing protein n=1 Tax=Paenibacillus sp. Marseille-Q4541 TaxID=2831522 RepID=UPI001BA7EBA4|nr:cellobiose phosphorylase [Paenibacillus sp. Marseille-Q4541]
MTTMTKSKIHMQAGELCFTFWESGDLYQILNGRTMINQQMLSPLDGSINNLYLRVHGENGITFYPMLGTQSDSTFYAGDSFLEWKGIAAGVAYHVTFAPTSKGVWFWDVKLSGKDTKVDVIYGQDIGIADVGAVRSNEAYLSQYIDHTAFHDEKSGYVVCSRQNQPQGGEFPYLQQGSLTESVSYSTDGFQFFGLSYKETNQPEILIKSQLAGEVYQYEFAYTALQSVPQQLAGEAHFIFYGLFKPNHAEAVTELEYQQDLDAAWTEYTALLAKQSSGQLKTSAVKKVHMKSIIGDPVQTESMTDAEIEILFPTVKRHQEERDQGELLAFFTDTYEHIVLKAKEMRIERPHGHILMSGGNVKLGEKVITTTSYMYGIFNSHLVIGNTNFNKLMSNARNALNLSKTAGQRIYVEIDGVYRLLTMPSLFEIGFNYVRWYYKMKEETLIITNFTTVDSSEVKLHVRSESGTSYRYLVTNQITMNVNEYELPIDVREENGVFIIKADKAALSQEVHPNLEYRMWVDGADYSACDETFLMEGIHSLDASLLALNLEASQEWTLTFQGSLDGEEVRSASRSAVEETELYRSFFREVMNDFHLDHPDQQKSEQLFKVNALAWWYTHNMLVHYSVPHGLEQYGGAAWGTRDVCQGPVEYFMATQKYEQISDIIKMVYSHQFQDDGNWPQWFMFDQYFKIQQEESHGDIIVWPLKVLSDYLNTTGDYRILQEQVPYTVKEGFGFSQETFSILDHAKKEIEYIRTHFLHDTFLSSYGDGDWDDTLQPANAQLKQYMVSSWTVALTYQTVTQLSRALAAHDESMSAELAEMASGIKRDYEKYMLATGVIPGFVYMEDPNQAKLMLHPEDRETGIQYRLLPMTRSIIAELLNSEQAKSHYDLIKERLYCPDGVRLMNRPAVYAGGVSTHFKRAEQAANFGREVGLQYVHAHIRYVEAMAKLGLPEEVWNGLAIINPVGITDVVPNAELRQSNAYFSSSDGKFNNRYEAQDHFDQLRSGEVQVKGGWRIYSSGPGIYMNQLISAALGIRQEQGDLVLDPVLPAELDGLRFGFEFAGRKITFIYHISGNAAEKVMMNGKEIPATLIDNPYRDGGLQISRDTFESLCNEDDNEIEIFV